MRRGRPLHRQALFARSRFGSRRLLRTLHRGQPVDSDSELTECSLILGKRKKQTLPQLSPQLTAPTSVCLPASSVVSDPPLSPLIDKLESFNKQNHSILKWFRPSLKRQRSLNIVSPEYVVSVTYNNHLARIFIPLSSRTEHVVCDR